MPAMLGRSHRRRRAMNEINMVPFIDVMLVLLIIFMVTAPLITPGVVDLPRVGKSAQQPPRVVQVIVAADGSLKLGRDGQADTPVALRQLAAQVKRAQAEAARAAGTDAAQVPVIISADRAVKYDSVMQAMSALQEQGVARVGLAVQPAR
jgi:biopolymer transport protein TolR